VIVSLELLRGLACLEVLGCHLLQMAHRMKDENFLSIIFEWGFPAVMVFFCLSGFIISRSQAQHQRSRGRYVLARVYRIVPVYLVAVLLSLYAEWFRYGHASWAQLLAHLSFLQTTQQERLPWEFATNGSLWSLSQEWWFYMFFALTFGPFQVRRLWVWLGLGILSCALLESGWSINVWMSRLLWILCFSPLWVAAALLGRQEARPVFSLSQALLMFGLIPLLQSEYRIWEGPNLWGCYLIGIVSFLLISSLVAKEKPVENWKSWGVAAFAYGALVYCFWSHPRTQRHEGYDQQYPWFDWFIVLVPAMMALAGRIPLWSSWRGIFRPSILVLGRLSYSVYLIHLPVAIVAGICLRVGEYPWRWMYVIGLIGTIAALLEYGYHPLVMRMIGPRNPPPQPKA